MRVLSEDAGDTEAQAGGLTLDRGDELGNPTADRGWREVAPTGERLQLETMVDGEVLASTGLSTMACSVLPRTVQPDAESRLAREQCSGALRAWPVCDSVDQGLLDAMSEQIPEPPHLHQFLRADEDGLVTTLQQRAAPAMRPSRFLGEVRVDIAHEPGKLVGIGWRYQEMVVVRQASVRVDLDVIPLRGSSQDADEQLGEAGEGPEEEPPLHRPGGDFYQQSFGNEAQTSAHAS